MRLSHSSNKLYALIGFMVFLVMAIPINAQEYGPTWDKVGENHIIFYDDIRNVYEDGQWKRIEDADSLLGVPGIELIIDEDPDYPVHVVDFSYSSITIEAEIKNSKDANVDVPLKVLEYDVDQKDFIETGNQRNERFAKIDEKRTITLDSRDEWDITKQIKFGQNSTYVSITSTTALTGVLYDSDCTSSPGCDAFDQVTVVGSGEYLGQRTTGAGRLIRGFATFDTSSIPDDAILVNATLNIWKVAHSGSPPGVVVYQVDHGGSIDCSDWGITGTNLGTVMTTGSSNSAYAQLSVATSSINLTGNTMYKLDTGQSCVDANNYYQSSNSASQRFIDIYYDVPPPFEISVSLDSPADNSTNSSSDITFAYTPIFQYGTAENCSLWGNFTGNWSLNVTNSTGITNSTSNYFIVNGIANQSLVLWNVECFDNTTNSTFAPSNYTLFIDLQESGSGLPTNLTDLLCPGEISALCDTSWTSASCSDSSTLRLINNCSVYVSEGNETGLCNYMTVKDVTCPNGCYEGVTELGASCSPPDYWIYIIGFIVIILGIAFIDWAFKRRKR